MAELLGWYPPEGTLAQSSDKGLFPVPSGSPELAPVGEGLPQQFRTSYLLQLFVPR